MYEVYHNIFIITAILAAIAFVISVILFIRLRIPKVINDMTGRTAKKEIERIHQRNIEEQSESKQEHRKMNRSQQSVITDRITPPGQIQDQNSVEYCVTTEKVETAKLSDEGEATWGGTNEETVVLDSCMIQSQVVVIEDITFIHTTEVIAS